IRYRQQDFLGGLERKSVVDQRQGGGGAPGQRDLLRLRTEIRRDFLLHLPRQEPIRRAKLEHPLLDGEEGVFVDRAAKTFDRGAHRLWMGGDEEARKMQVLRRKAKLPPNAGPVIQPRHRGRLCLHRRQQLGREQRGAQNRAVRREEGTPGEVHRTLLGLGPQGYSRRLMDVQINRSRLKYVIRGGARSSYPVKGWKRHEIRAF